MCTSYLLAGNFDVSDSSDIIVIVSILLELTKQFNWTHILLFIVLLFLDT